MAMKGMDSRRLNAFIKDEREAVEIYSDMAELMEKEGRSDFAELYREMAKDEDKHASYVIFMKQTG